MTTMQNVDEVKNLYRMPDVTFFDESDNQYTTKTFNNSLIVMYFWATWCLECTEELVQLNQLQKRLTIRRHIRYRNIANLSRF